MIPITTAKDQRIAVFGLGRSGLVTCAALRAGGADVAPWDDHASAREMARAQGFEPVDLTNADWSQFHALVLAPGVPLTHPQPHWTVVRAKAADVEIIGDVELFCRERRHLNPHAPFVAITGTNGKSTTTALTAHILRAAGFNAAVGGNIGVAVLSLPALDGNTAYVVEMSSYQIDLTPSLDPTVGVLLNVTPDHIDRHGTFAAYAAVKKRLAMAAHTAVVCTDDAVCDEAAIARQRIGWPLVTLSSQRPNADVIAQGPQQFRLDQPNTGSPAAFDLAGIASLRGAHNLQNAMAAVATARLLAPHAPAQSLQAGLASFAGLPHRMEQIAERGRVVFVNDSKATNADSADKALAAFDRDIFWIAGGLPKDGGIERLRPHFAKIKRAYLIGEAAPAFAQTIGDACDAAVFDTLERATRAAARDAAQSVGAEPVVLFSPACASFDQFRNFEIRGDAFRTVVAGLKGARLRQRAKL